MRLIRYMLLVLFCSLFLWITWATFSYDDFVVQFQSTSTNLSITEKKAYYLKVYNNLSLLAIRNRNDTQQFTLYTSLKDYVNTQLKNLWNISSSTISYASSGMNIPKVDLAKVRTAWLALHNAERKTLWLTSFTYSPALEWTATTWAQHLADIGTVTHQRKSTDGYYSYDSIKQRFFNQWIVFADKEKNGQPLFTENIWWNIYSCNKTDCTDDFIKAIKLTWTFFMSEKGKTSSPHYNAIIGNFTSIGLGVVLVGNKYYLVTHYTQALK